MESTGSILLPSRYKKATLVDLLDRVLEKGVVINADLIVSVAGIPLLGINLRAALAGMETMLRYGLMRDWDERTRNWERKQALERELVAQEAAGLMAEVRSERYEPLPAQPILT